MNTENFNLEKGDQLLVDLDGTITIRETYPEFSPPDMEVVEFLNKCKQRGISIYIWTARCNNTSAIYRADYKDCGSAMIVKVRNYLNDYNIPFDDILILTKPLSGGRFKYMLDNKATHDIKDFKFND